MIVKIAYNKSEAPRVNCLDNIDFYRQPCKAHFPDFYLLCSLFPIGKQYFWKIEMFIFPLFMVYQ